MSFQDYSSGLDVHLELVEVLNTTSQELDEKASGNSQTQIEQTIRNVNERWNILKTKANDRRKALEVGCTFLQETIKSLCLSLVVLEA